jgi:hypothetical protein
MRYSTTQILKDENLRRYFNTVILPSAPESNGDIFIQTTTVDRLDKLAYVFYDDATQWWVIASANGLGKGTYMVPANTRLRIPNPTINMQQVIIETNNDR